MSTSRFSTPEPELIDALAVCLDAMAIGSDLETALGMYPTLAEDLRPLLLTAQTAQVLTPVQIPVDAMNRSRTKILGRAANYRTSRDASPGFWGWARRLPRAAMSSLLTVVVLFVGLFALNSTANAALPGDALYPLKLSFEGLWQGITPGSQAQDALEQAYRQRRVDEVQQLLALGREESVTFEGVLAARELLSGIAPERLLVSDIPVLNMIDTETIGEIEIGMLIQVEGRTRPDGYVEATVLRPRAFAFVGVVEAMTTDIWTVGGRAVGIRAESELAPGIGLGNEVMVLAEFDDQANLFARAILFTGNPDATPTPDVSPTLDSPSTEPPVTSTPSPTTTPSPSPTPSPTATFEEPTATPTIQPTATTPPESTEEADDNENDNSNDNGDDNDNDDDNTNDNDEDNDNDNSNDNDNDNDNENSDDSLNENDNDDDNDNNNDNDNTGGGEDN